MIRSTTIVKSQPHVLKTVNLVQYGKPLHGKVRDYVVHGDTRIIVTTDRQSAFDVNLGFIPYKGAVLNQLAAFWFDKTQHIIPNHKISVPHPNVLFAHNCTPIPVEMVVRGYISGVTKTSIWYSYKNGERVIYGLRFPDGLSKNQKLPKAVITPTTHGGGKGGHDERLTRDEIIKRKIVGASLYRQMERTALNLFDFGSAWCKKHGLLLVDTKYEFGLYQGKLMLMDEIHTPDSSRFWIEKNVCRSFQKGLEPENYDKEFLRLWYVKRGYSGDGKPPPMSEQLIMDLANRYISVYEKITGRKFIPYTYPIESSVSDAIDRHVKKPEMEKITYSQVGDNYGTKDPVKISAQSAALTTGSNLQKHGFSEVTGSRGGSAYVWKQGSQLMASVIEGLGTKNLVADAMRQVTGKTYYDAIAHDTVATIINDLITVGATPLVLHAYWAIGDNIWLDDTKRMADLIHGWKRACDIAGVSWGGGESPTLRGIIDPQTVEMGGSAVGIIKPAKNLITDKKITPGDAIILIRSTGINANGLSLARAISTKLKKGYATPLPDGTLYGEAILTKSNIYAELVAKLQNARIHIHYLSNITGHGLRKIMRAKGKYSYVIEKIFPPHELFHFIQKHAGLSDYEMYETFNMGMDYAIFLPEKEREKVLKIVQGIGFEGIHAGQVETGPRRVVIKPKNITFHSETLALR